MQCPTCGNDTPGTLGKCSHCAAPIDVYSVGPSVPLAAPVTDAPPAADDLGDRTMRVPPPAPSWVTDAQRPAASDPTMPPHPAPGLSSMPGSPGVQSADAASAVTPSTPMSAFSAPGAAPPPGPQAMPGSADTAGNPTSDSASAVTPMNAIPPPTPGLHLPPDPQTVPGNDHSATPAADPQAMPGAPPSDDHSATVVSHTGTGLAGTPMSGAGQGAYGAEPHVPGAAPGGGGFPAPGTPPVGGMSSVTAGTPMGLPVQSGAGAGPEDTAAWTFDPDEDDDSGAFGTVRQQGWGDPKPAPPAQSPHNTFGVREEPRPTESIVPDSWFAQPRRPDADATQVQPPAPPTGGPQFAPAPMTNPGAGGGMEQTRLDPGSPMSPMGAPPPMGPGAPNMMGPGAPNVAGPGAPNMMGPGGPAYGYQPGTGKPGGGPSKPLIGLVAALVTVAAGAVIFAWPSGGDGKAANATPAPSTSAPNTPVAQQEPLPNEAKQQAAVLNAILDDSSSTRQVLAGSIGRAGKCKTLPQAIQGFQKVAQQRQDQLRRTRELQVDRLANGERLRGTLAQALQASLDVDLVLLRWAQANQRRGCKGKPKPAAAQVPGRAGAERRATNAKIQFVRLWNPVATKTGHPKRSWKLV